MTTEKLEQAEGWFKLHDIPTIVDDGSIYVQTDDGFELQLSTAEIEYRAELYSNFQPEEIKNQ
jgi:hypothetical protein